MHDLPIGFGFALAQNTEAMQYFTSLSEAEQNALIEQSKTMQSRKEMHHFVQQLGHHQENI